MTPEETKAIAIEVAKEIRESPASSGQEDLIRNPT